MSANIIPKTKQGEMWSLPAFLHRSLRKMVLGGLKNLAWGSITVIDGDERIVLGHARTGGGPHVTLNVNDPAFYAYAAFGGSVGAGQAYFLGLWDADHLTDLLRILVHNRAQLDKLETGLARFSAPLYKLFHRLHDNHQRGSRKNISAHYDLSNDFFALFLDPGMMYSCAIYPTAQTSLEEAQFTRLSRICEKLELSPDDHVIEIGTGWGGFALHAARHYGARVTTTTISREQFDYAQARVRDAGLEAQITVLFEDYRELHGCFDKLVSIEMIEAVGHQYFDTFFQKCSDLLHPGGQMLLQAITIEDYRFERAKGTVDFIQRYVFPGSCIPSVTAMSASIARVTDLRLFHLEDIGPHYATTLRHWRKRLFARLDEVYALGFSAEFIRLWEFYLCYCEAGFAERATGNVHMLLTKPMCRRAPVTG